MSVDDFSQGHGQGSSDEMQPLVATASETDAGPLGLLPRLSLRHARLASRLARLGPDRGPGSALAWLAGPLGTGVAVGPAEVAERAVGLRRVGVVVQLVWPRFSSRVGIGLETPLAHAVVDRLLGFDRAPEDSRLQVSPVEWGVLTFVAAESLGRLTSQPGPLGAWDLTLDRVNPDPFDVAGLGRVTTMRWPLRIGEVEGSIRLWVPETLLVRWLAAPAEVTGDRPARAGEFASNWRVQAGTIALKRGLKTIRTGGVLPLADSRLRGTAKDPAGAVELSLLLTGQGGRYAMPAEIAPLSGGGRVRLTGPLRFETTPREPVAVSTQPTNPDAAQAQPVTDVPMTLVVELGRVNLTLSRLADLKPGDVVELGRHSREPVELTSGGRLIARGELVQIDTELGVRVTNVFL